MIVIIFMRWDYNNDMKFYDILQMDPAQIRAMIAKTENAKEKRKLRAGMYARSFLIVVFAVLFIGIFTALFGSGNSAMAVSIFCILLAVRFVDYGYRIQDALVNMFIVFAILTFVPSLALPLPWPARWLIYFASLLIMLIMTAEKPHMGNGGLYTFAFIFLAGNPVYGQVLMQRAQMAFLGFLICACVYWHNHRSKDKKITFANVLKRFDLYTYKTQWQLRLALGISVLLCIFTVFHLERYMWAGFAAGSLLSDADVESNIHEKFSNRLLGVILGSALFYMIYLIVPARYYFLIGPVGGMCLGLCSKYTYKTVLNCFGALALAASMYGIGNAVLLRIFDTLAGIFGALLFFYLYDRFILHKFLPNRSYVSKKEK